MAIHFDLFPSKMHVLHSLLLSLLFFPVQYLSELHGKFLQVEKASVHIDLKRDEVVPYTCRS